MIAVTLRDVPYRIWWEYDRVRVIHAGGRMKSYNERTWCLMSKDEHDAEVLCRVSVVKHFKDPHNKDKARRYSLLRLMAMMLGLFPTKTERKAVWNAYMEMIKPKPKKEATNV